MASVRRVQPVVLLPGTVVLPTEEVNRVVRETNAALDTLTEAVTAVEEALATKSVAPIAMLGDATGGTVGSTVTPDTTNGLATVVAKVNEVISALRRAGIA